MIKCIICNNLVHRKYQSTVVKKCSVCGCTMTTKAQYNNLVKVSFNANKRALGIFWNSNETISDIKMNLFFKQCYIKNTTDDKKTQKKCSICGDTIYKIVDDQIDMYYCNFDQVLYFQIKDYDKMIRRAIDVVNHNKMKIYWLYFKSLFKKKARKNV